MGESVLSIVRTDPFTRQTFSLNGRPVSAAEQVRLAIGNPLPKPNLNFVSLNLYGTNITDAGAAELQKALPKCKILHFYKKD